MPDLPALFSVSWSGSREYIVRVHREYMSHYEYGENGEYMYYGVILWSMESY